MRRFEELRVWQDARILVRDIYTLTQNLKDYGFKDQIQRAAVSIMNNIAEGCDSGTDALFLRYLHIAKGSCAEAKSMLYLSEDLEYSTKEHSLELINKTQAIAGSIQKLIDYLKKEQNNTK